MQSAAARLLAALIIVSISALMQASISCAAEVRKKNGATAQPAVQAKPVASQQQNDTLLNEITKAAVQAGVTTCTAKIKQITDFIPGTIPHGALIFPAPLTPDKKQFSVSMEVSNQASSVPSYVTATFSPAADGSCSASYEATTYWVSPCADIAKNVFGVFKLAPKALHQQISILGDTPTVRVFLLPVITGCISIKKEIIY